MAIWNKNIAPFALIATFNTVFSNQYAELAFGLDRIAKMAMSYKEFRQEVVVVVRHFPFCWKFYRIDVHWNKMCEPDPLR